jgi:hypothetical protein
MHLSLTSFKYTIYTDNTLHMPRNQVILLGKVYKTQTEFSNFVKNFIYNEIGLCDNVKITYPEKYEILIEILKRHPEFILKTFDMNIIKLVKDTTNKKAIKIIIVRNDMSEIDISWRTAITGKHNTDKQELMSAMRSCIESQINKFRKENDIKCSICSSSIKPHVDHVIQFNELAMNFIKLMKEKNIQIPAIFGDMDDGTHRRCFLPVDNNFKNDWYKYHSDNAILRILCQHCNLTRAKPTIKK